MGELILCKQNIAAMPYYVEGLALNIYTIEELCYCMVNNTELIDAAFPTEELVYWLDRELGLDMLAKELLQDKEEQGSVERRTELILSSCNYCSQAQIDEVKEQLAEFENRSETECGKIRADRQLKNKKYACAIREYRKLLGMDAMKREDAKLVGSICHNLGVAYTGMLQYEMAASYFKEAYAYNNQPESMKQYYFAKQCVPGHVPVDGEIEQAWQDVVTYDLQRAIEAMRKEEPHPLDEQQLQQWKSDYRKYSRLS